MRADHGHMRLDERGDAEQRGSALWGRGGRGDRASALWRRGGRGFVTLVVLVAASIAPASGIASSSEQSAYVPSYLLARAEANPNEKFEVIVVGTPSTNAGAIKNEKMKDANGNQFGQIKHEFKYALDGVLAEITGGQLLALARKDGIRAIAPDAPVRAEGLAPVELWPLAIGADRLWGTRDALTGLYELSGPAVPTIAVVDTGVQKDRVADFGGRVVDSVVLASDTSGDSGSDPNGHGTMVAGLAAGAAVAYPGVAPTANIVSIRVLDREGRGKMSDVIRAVDWVYENRASKGIRVVNISLNSPHANWGVHDPLNIAVRRLWLSGTVVVTAAGNNGPQRMLYAPASDPFVITVGAVDINRTIDTADDACPPWSSYGYTADGFAKPELGAPGRYMVAPVPESSLLATSLPSRVVAPGYMWMSGSSFAAAVVSGTAAQILARHPSFGPDEVKGALMLSARGLPAATPMCAGVGEIDAAAAAAVASPPNPNENLNAFVLTLGDGRKSFDVSAWQSAVSSNSNWTSSNWIGSNWTESNWVSSNWTASQWSASNWTNSNWTQSNWTQSNWTLSNWVE